MSDANEVTELPEVDFPEDTRLFNIAIWSGTVGWVVLIFGLLQTILELVRMYQNGVFNSLAIQLHPLEAILTLLSIASPVIRYVIWWFFLLALKEFLFLMIDIKESMQTDTQEI